MTLRPHAPAIGLALSLAAGMPVALGQNALGDGRGLEKQFQITDQWIGNTARPDFRNEVRMRNAVVTGNVGGGKSFQGNITYKDPDDFRGVLGSDSLFRFRRDSYGVGVLNNIGFRSTESLQYQFNFATGNARDMTLFTRSVGNTPSTGAAGPGPAKTTYDFVGSDEAAPELGTLRSTAAFTANRGLSPALVGFQTRRTGATRVTASSLLGVRSDNLVPDFTSGRLVEELPSSVKRPPTGPATAPAGSDVTPAVSVKTLAEELRDKMDARAGYDRAAAEKARPATAPAKPDATKPAAEPGKPAPSKPDATRPAPEPAAPEGAKPPAEPGKTDQPPDAMTAPWERQLWSIRSTLMGLPTRDTKPTEEPGADEKKRRAIRAGLDDETLRILRENNETVSAYLAGAAPPEDMFATHLQAGQDLMARGQYFDAEERFARALAIRAGDATAMIARVNAQIGAGLYLSAAINLRQTFEQHPELLAVRYAGGTIPSPERLKALKDELTLAVAGPDASPGKRPDAAILLAYAGYQTGDQAAIRTGLAGLRASHDLIAATLVKAGQTPSPDTLGDLMARVWLNEGEGAVSTPPETPGTPAAEPSK
jgi:hypothetical protein